MELRVWVHGLIAAEFLTASAREEWAGMFEWSDCR